MRAFEIVLSLMNIVTFAALAVPRLGTVRWTGVVAAAAALATCLQLLAEGPRWQMLPAYVLAVAFLVVWLAGLAFAWRLRDGGVIAGFAVGLGALVLAASLALPVALPVFRFPRPTGPYAIGSVTYHWVDASRPELFTTDPNDHRELMAQVWYPAKDEPSAPRVQHMENADAISAAMARIVHLPRFFFAHFKYVMTNAVSHAPLADDKRAYPVLIFLSGLGGFRGSNTFQVEELVSHGYVVVGLDQPGGSAAVSLPDGRTLTVPPRDEIQPLIQQSTTPRQPAPALNNHELPNGIIPCFAEDASFAIDQVTALNGSDPNGLLAGRLDVKRVGVFGISLGAIVAAEASRMDSRINAALLMDAAMPADVVQAGLLPPCLWITRPAADMRLERSRSGGWSESSITETLTSMRAVFDKHAQGSAYYLDMPGMFHVNFTDAPFWSPLTTQLGLTGPVNGKHMWNVINAYSLAFFDTYLKGEQAPLLDGQGRHDGEVRLQRR